MKSRVRIRVRVRVGFSLLYGLEDKNKDEE